ncbi:hypothetical protein DID88_007767 [Monilinia fructigena]|uniref:Uncharacterized protein n=1 Tax=Monilinia fructigena TaxID=38457 RepID=A0A395J387_9HELO|nr:hypothetical protein DID88_007767 [Monilinia fructigena]
MLRSLSQGFFIQRRLPTTGYQHRSLIISVDFRRGVRHDSRLSHSNQRSLVSPPTSISISKIRNSTLRNTELVPTPQWQKSKVWSKIFQPYFHERYKPLPKLSTPVPLWDIAPGCILFVPGKSRLSVDSLRKINQYGHVGMCGHPVLVLAVDIKGPNEGTVGLSTIRTFSQHKEECRFLGLDWFDTTHFEIHQYGRVGKPPPLEHNIKKLRLYKTPNANSFNFIRQFIETTAIFTISRVIKEDFMQICETIGFTPDPWHSSGPYMWKNFVEKTGIDTFGFDLDDPALYNEKAFYQEMWEEGKAKYYEFYNKSDAENSDDYSPLGWEYDREPYIYGRINKSPNRSPSLVRRYISQSYQGVPQVKL